VLLLTLFDLKITNHKKKLDKISYTRDNPKMKKNKCLQKNKCERNHVLRISHTRPKKQLGKTETESCNANGNPNTGDAKDQG